MLKRVRWIDAAKGITILTVIIGHTIGKNALGNFLRGIIFSFHMPLFFILSEVTSRCPQTNTEFISKTKKSFSHLIIPAVFVFFVLTVSECVKDYYLIGDKNYWIGKIYTFVFASGVKTTFGDIEIRMIGIPWFLFCLFFGRTIFDYLHMCFDDIQLHIISWAICMIGIVFGKIQWLPFSIDIALAIMPLFYYGNKMDLIRISHSPFKKMFLWGGIWIFSFLLTFPDFLQKTYFELAIRRYPLFPICYLSAIAGTMCVCEFSVLCCRIKGVNVFLEYLGKKTIYLLCIHCLDSFCRNVWYVADRQYLSSVNRVICDLVIFAIVMFLINVFQRVRRCCTTKTYHSLNGTKYRSKV